MGGISGLFFKKREADKDFIRKMNDLVAHRGPDGEGFFYDDAIAFGYRQLSSGDFSEKAKLPYDDGNSVLMFDGSIYNAGELKEELPDHASGSSSDAALVLAAYGALKEKCVERFRGMWSLVIYDRQRQELFCSRDRFGIKPFYYYDTADYFAFGSEIKQFTCLPGWRAVVNEDRLKDFLLFEMMDHTEETLFQQVKQLPPGYNLVYSIKEKSYRMNRYYDPAPVAGKDKRLENVEQDTHFENVEKASEVFLGHMQNSIREHLRTDTDAGSSLSGGLDSSAIAVLMHEQSLSSEGIRQHTQTAVSSCSNKEKYDEQQYIDALAGHLSLQVYKVFPDIADLLIQMENIAWHQDEPFGSTSIYAQWRVFEEAKRRNIHVLLDGQGADEILAGYFEFHGAHLNEMIRAGSFTKWFREMNALHYQRHYACLSLIRWSLRFWPVNWSREAVKIILRNGACAWTKTDAAYFRRFTQNAYRRKIRTLRDYSLNLLYTSLPKLMHWLDRDSMAHAVEARVPFLDHRVVEEILGTPADFKLKDGTTKYILREAMRDHIPAEIIDRKDKMGFVTPEEPWIRENPEAFRQMFIDGLDCMAKIVDKEKALRWFDATLRSHKPIDFTIWRVISIGYWFKAFSVEWD